MLFRSKLYPRFATLPLFVALLLLLNACDVRDSGITGKVINVADGDTVTMMIDGRKEKIRLYGIDAPELRQAFGKRAKLFTKSMAYGKTVSLLRMDQDRYGRTVGVITVDGISLNEALVTAGYAWHYRQFSRDSKLDALELEARLKRKGLWADPNPTPPWEFRKKKKRRQSNRAALLLPDGESSTGIVYLLIPSTGIGCDREKG